VNAAVIAPQSTPSYCPRCLQAHAPIDLVQIPELRLQRWACSSCGARWSATGEPVIKICSCSREYTRASWDALPDKKVYTLEWGEVHEQRHCRCGSHIIMVLDPGETHEVKAKDRWRHKTTSRIARILFTRPSDIVYVYDKPAGERMVEVTWAEFYKDFTFHKEA